MPAVPPWVRTGMGTPCSTLMLHYLSDNVLIMCVWVSVALVPGSLDDKGICLLMQETRVLSLGQEDPWREAATLLSLLAWRIPWTEGTGGL